MMQSWYYELMKEIKLNTDLREDIPRDIFVQAGIDQTLTVNSSNPLAFENI
jgi:hypothetical protein